jgi:class 3 adenylate cyclase
MLVPALCTQCREQVCIEAAQAQLIDPAATGPMTVWREVGCAECKQNGTVGQLALHEVLMIDDDARPLLADYLEKGDLKNPLPPGHITLLEAGRELVRRGELGFETYKREIARNPVLRMPHQWELERRHGASMLERLTKLRRFFSPSVAELILSGSVEDPLKSHRREIVVVFLDLRGFTAFAETSDPEDVMRVLGDYHTAMGELVMSHGGTLERFAGDGMMIFLNDPVEVDDPAHDAVVMAAHMQRRFDEVRHGWRRLGIDLAMGIGIAQGYATIGAIGFEGRRDYGAIGVVTNLAARLCAEAQGGQILVSQRVFGAIEERFEADAVGALSLRGFRGPVEAYAIRWQKAQS